MISKAGDPGMPDPVLTWMGSQEDGEAKDEEMKEEEVLRGLFFKSIAKGFVGETNYPLNG